MAERRSAQRLTSDSSVHLYKQHMDLLAHYNALVESTDKEMLQMIALLDKTRLSWLASTQENAGLKAVKESIERENKKLLDELDTTKGRLKESEAQVVTLRTTMHSMKIEIEEYQRRFQQIKTMLRENCENAGGMTKLKELSFLADASAERSKHQSTSRAAAQNLQASRGSDLSQANTDNDIDYDKTGETMEDEDEVVVGVPAHNNGRHNRADYHRAAAPRTDAGRARMQKPATKRKSGPRGRRLPSDISEEEEEIFVGAEEPQCPTPPKRSREARGHQVTTITIDTSSSTPSRANVTITKPPSGRIAQRRSQSAPGVPHCQPLQGTERVERTPKAQKCGSTMDIRTTPVGTTGFGSGWTCGVPIAERNHTWEKVSAFLSSLNTPCTACGSTLSKVHFKCKGEGCKFIVHDKCRARAPLPCVPYKQTPKKVKQRPRLVELCPETQPKIPGLLMRCVVTLEKDRLGFEGIYRRAGSRAEVLKLLEDFNSKVAPDLSTRETETITSGIVQFLQGLREPLVPSNSFKEFEEAAKQEDVKELMEVVNDLPIPNRDTLAYMCAHLQHVAENAHVNKMSLENLARVLALTMIDGSKRAKNTEEEYREAESRQHILKRLLEIPNAYWMNFVNAAVITGQLGSTPRSVINLRGMAASASRAPLGQRTIDFRSSDESILGPVATDDRLVQPIPRRPGKHALGGPY